MFEDQVPEGSWYWRVSCHVLEPGLKLDPGEAEVSEGKLGLEVGEEVLWKAVVVLSFGAVRCVSCIFISLFERVSSLVLSVREAKSH